MAIKKSFIGIDADVSNFISKKEVVAIQSAVSEVNKNERLSLYVPAEIMKQIKLIAGATGTSKNKLVIDLMEQALQNPKYQKICAAMIEVNKNINN
jgi:carbonic anhydrase/acetyltransferase-like protein (isoleucine patch superfamily)